MENSRDCLISTVSAVGEQEKLVSLAKKAKAQFAHLKEVPPQHVVEFFDEQRVRFDIACFRAGISNIQVPCTNTPFWSKAPAMRAALLATLELLVLQLHSGEYMYDNDSPLLGCPERILVCIHVRNANFGKLATCNGNGRWPSADGATANALAQLWPDVRKGIETTITQLYRLSVLGGQFLFLSTTDLTLKLQNPALAPRHTTMLASRLLGQRVWSSFSSKYFIPVRDLSTTLDPRVTRNVLEATGFDPATTDICLAAICGPPPEQTGHRNFNTPPSPEPRHRKLRNIFAILVLLDEVDALQAFVKASIDDNCLPLSPDSFGNDTNRHSLSVDPSVIQRFLEMQWVVHVPELIGNHLLIPDEAIVPCTEAQALPRWGELNSTLGVDDNASQNSADDSPKPIVLEYSPVWKVRIHSAHMSRPGKVKPFD